MLRPPPAIIYIHNNFYINTDRAKHLDTQILVMLHKLSHQDRAKHLDINILVTPHKLPHQDRAKHLDINILVMPHKLPHQDRAKHLDINILVMPHKLSPKCFAPTNFPSFSLSSNRQYLQLNLVDSVKKFATQFPRFPTLHKSRHQICSKLSEMYR